jgi:hypothetical protein
MSIGRLIFHVESRGTNPVNMATNQSFGNKNVEKELQHAHDFLE